MPPMLMTAMPINGDQARWWGLSLMILTVPISATFSLVKTVIAVKMVNTKPIIIMKIPAFFI